ncbi:MAG: hypothetical protein AAB875_05120 [Patescibacteria group bacterium]
MVVTLCTSGSVKLAAGNNVSTALTDSDYTLFINQAEGDIVADTRVNYVSAYSAMSADYRKILEGACAAKAAVKAVRFAPSNYSKLGEAITIVNICLDEYDRAIAVLKRADVIKALGVSYMDTA